MFIKLNKMIMDFKILKNPPKDIKSILSGKELADLFKRIVGKKFVLTKKARTDGSNLRKLISAELAALYTEIAPEDSYHKKTKKGIPKILIQCIDTYIVTSGESYNLQVWNRIPNSNSILIQYNDGNVIRANDIRLVIVKIDRESNKIESVVVMTPKFIEATFGKFGIPTLKHQLMISDKKRKEIESLKPPILFESDTAIIRKLAKCEKIVKQKASIKENPESKKLYKLEVIRDSFQTRIIGMSFPALQTKNKGQLLEKEISELLGYENENMNLMEGLYPDIRHQLLEVKIQDSPTVDLGKYSPLILEKDFCGLENVTTEDVRYLIALTDKQDLTVKALVLMPGKKLVDNFSYVSETSYKCQRSIPMSFLNSFRGKSIFLG